MKRRKTLYLSAFEVQMMVLLTAKLDPEKFAGDEARALILKCKAEKASPSDWLTVE